MEVRLQPGLGGGVAGELAFLAAELGAVEAAAAASLAGREEGVEHLVVHDGGDELARHLQDFSGSETELLVSMLNRMLQNGARP